MYALEEELARIDPATLQYLDEAIQNLPPELREMILKEYIAIKIKGKKRKWGGTR